MNCLRLVAVGLVVFGAGCTADDEEIALSLAVGPSPSADHGAPVVSINYDGPEQIDLELTAVIQVGDAVGDSVHQALLGVVSGPDPAYKSTAPNVSLYLADIGATSVRNDGYGDGRLDMETIFSCADGETYPSWDCNPNKSENYNWSSSDSQFDSWLKDPVLEPFLRLGGEAESLTEVHDYKGPANAKEEKNWIKAAAKVVERYDNWKGQNNTLNYVQIWSEWPGEAYWSRSNEAFVNFWARAYADLKKSSGKIKLGGPGFSTAASRQVITGENGYVVEFLEHLYDKGVVPDWLGWHLHSNRPSEFADAASAYRELLDGNGVYAWVKWGGSGFFDGVELVADSWGTSEFDESGELMSVPEVDRVFNRREGASKLTASWIAMQHTGVTRAYYRRCGDAKSDPSVDPEKSNALHTEIGGPGLFYGDLSGAYKPSAHSMRLWTRMVNEFSSRLEVPAVVEAKDAKLPLWTLAGVDSKGRRALLVANANPEPTTWWCQFKGVPASPEDFSQVTLYSIDGAQNGKEAVAWSGETVFEIGAFTSQLVVFEP